jgi:hypothetical protein
MAVGCPRGHTVLIVVARQGLMSEDIATRPVLVRTWDARGQGERTMPDVRPGQAAWRRETQFVYMFDFSTPSRIRTCAHGSGVHCRSAIRAGEGRALVPGRMAGRLSGRLLRWAVLAGRSE